MAKRKPARVQIPFQFVLDELESLDPVVRPMFGCHAIYIASKIVLILRDKPSHKRDNGIWLATSVEHHESLKKDFPQMRDIEMFGEGPSSWQNLPADDVDFEELALKACLLVRKNDLRIGKIPKPKKKAQKKLPKKLRTKPKSKELRKRK